MIISPYVWGASLTGDAALAGRSTKVDIPFSDVVKHLDFAFMGAVEVTNGRLGAFLNGQYVRTSQDEAIGSRTLGVDVRTSMLAAGVYYRVYEYALGGATVFGAPRSFAIEPTAGARWTRLDGRLSTMGLSMERSASWTDPFVGLRISDDITERWTLLAEADIGGFGVGSKFSVNAQAFLGYRTMLFDRPTVLRAGYRALYQNYETMDFTGHTFRWNVTQHGPVAGFSMAF